MRALLLASVLTLFACDARQTLVTPDPHLERMMRQKRATPYAPSDFFANGSNLQWPPPGTVAQDDTTLPVETREGLGDGGYVAKIPIALSDESVERGEHDYTTFCSPCHGIAGDGHGPVALNMTVRKPPSLVDDPVTRYAPGQVFATITQGYGLMPSYRTLLDVDARWRVVAYVEALQLAHRARLADLPDDLRREAEEKAQ